jgi:hypothetical protein
VLILESREIHKYATFNGGMYGLLLKHVAHIITTMFQTLKLYLYTPWRHMGKWRYSATHSEAQLHMQAALPLGNSRYLPRRRLDWPHSRSGCFRKEEIYVACPVK